MPTPEQFLKIYLPALVGVLYFVGYHYINEYFRYFGVIGAYTKFSPIYLGFFSFGVFAEVLTFEDRVSSFRFLGLLMLLVLLALAPSIRDRGRKALRRGRGRVALTGWRRLALNFLSFLAQPIVRLLISFVAAYLILFNISGRIGYLHGCEKLTSTPASIQLFHLDQAGLFGQNAAAIAHAQDNDGLIEIWTDEDFVLVAEKLDSLDCSRPRILYRITHDQYNFLRTTREG